MRGKVRSSNRSSSARGRLRLPALLVAAVAAVTTAACTTSVGGQAEQQAGGASSGVSAPQGTGPGGPGTTGKQPTKPCSSATPEQLSGANTVTSAPATPGTETVLPQSNTEIAFGSEGSWKNGLRLAVSKPVTYTPSQPAGDAGRGEPVVITADLTNGSDDEVSGALDVTVISAGRPATALTDAELDNALINLAPGKRQQLRLGFRVVDRNDVFVVVSPGYSFQPLTFSAGAPPKQEAFRPSAVPEDKVARRCFGQSFVAADGLRLAVNAEPAQPVGAAAGDTGYRWVKVTVVVTNLSTVGQQVSLQPEVENTGAKATPFKDPSAGIGDSAGGWLPPGRRVAFVQGYKMRTGGVVTVALGDPANSDNTVIWSDS